MGVPILKQGDHLVASIQSALSDAERLGLVTDHLGIARDRIIALDHHA